MRPYSTVLKATMAGAMHKAAGFGSLRYHLADTAAGADAEGGAGAEGAAGAALSDEQAAEVSAKLDSVGCCRLNPG